MVRRQCQPPKLRERWVGRGGGVGWGVVSHLSLERGGGREKSWGGGEKRWGGAGGSLEARPCDKNVWYDTSLKSGKEEGRREEREGVHLTRVTYESSVT
jgi:hypothetical protein